MKHQNLNQKYQDLIPRLTAEEYSQLEKNIVANGCMDKIKVNKNNTILDGHNRWRICLKNDVKFEVEVLELGGEEAEKKWIYEHQLGRRNLTSEQRDMILGKLYNEQKQVHGGQLPKGIAQNDLSLSTAKKISKEQKVSEATVKRAGKLVDDVDAINKVDDTFGGLYLNSDIHATKNEITQLAADVKKDKVQAKKIIEKVIKEKKSISAARREVVNDSIENKTLKPTNKKYQVIYADPPWEYNSTLPQKYGDVEKHYSNMTLKDICDMPIKNISDANCVLFLWVTSPKLPLAFDVMRAWGFEYKTSFVWDKIGHNVGYYNSVRHEFLLIGGKGCSTPTMDKKVLHDSVISIQKSDKHSEKPEEFRKLIEELYPNTQKIELFARKTVKGWDNFGNQIGE
jgi:N6-adenosine-specific RNA methylase IME4/ParB-like chromosome segregation protein Spo0J